jgi:hypothetical protein
LLVGGYFGSTFHAEASHDDLLVVQFASGTSMLLSRLRVNIPQDAHHKLVIFYAFPAPKIGKTGKGRPRNVNARYLIISKRVLRRLFSVVQLGFAPKEIGAGT